MLKKIIHIIIVILGLIGIAATIIVLPVTTSVTIGTVLPAVVGVVLLAYGAIHLLRPGNIIKSKKFRIIVIIFVVIIIISFLMIEIFIIIGANSNVQEKEVNFVLVLGAGIFPDGRITLTQKNRLDKAYEYIEKHEQVICVVSGGKGKNEPISEAEAMRDYLLSRGVDETRIIIEPKSTSTKENLVFSAKLMQEFYPNKQMSVAVVTSDFHIFRSLILAGNSGMDAFGIPSEISWRIKINCYMREYLAVINTLLFQMN